MPHVPPMQLGVPVVEGQTLPQPPQLLTSVLVPVSHPLLGFPSQFLKPEPQTGVQAPALQEVVPCSLLHAVPQAPQLSSEVCVLVSQPLRGLPSQSAQPGSHWGTQVPPIQVLLPLLLTQVTPQAPQLEVLICVLVSQPSLGFPLQSRNPELHVGLHAPLTQLVVPLSLSQVAPQAPQLLTLFNTVSQPVASSLSQSPKPLPQELMAQLPPAQDSTALGKSQT